MLVWQTCTNVEADKSQKCEVASEEIAFYASFLLSSSFLSHLFPFDGFPTVCMGHNGVFSAETWTMPKWTLVPETGGMLAGDFCVEKRAALPPLQVCVHSLCCCCRRRCRRLSGRFLFYCSKQKQGKRLQSLRFQHCWPIPQTPPTNAHVGHLTHSWGLPCVALPTSM